MVPLLVSIVATFMAIFLLVRRRCWLSGGGLLAAPLLLAAATRWRTIRAGPLRGALAGGRGSCRRCMLRLGQQLAFGDTPQAGSDAVNAHSAGHAEEPEATE